MTRAGRQPRERHSGWLFRCFSAEMHANTCTSQHGKQYTSRGKIQWLTRSRRHGEYYPCVNRITATVVIQIVLSVQVLQVGKIRVDGHEQSACLVNFVGRPIRRSGGRRLTAGISCALRGAEAVGGIMVVALKRTGLAAGRCTAKQAAGCAKSATC
jgi:hypothetical protein